MAREKRKNDVSQNEIERNGMEDEQTEDVRYGIEAEEPIYEIDEATGLPDPALMSTEDIISYNDRVAEKGKGIMLEMPEGRQRPPKKNLGVVTEDTIHEAIRILNEYKKGNLVAAIRC